MKYITGIYALNLNCALKTPGDWHQSALSWDNPRMRETEGSLFGEYGIEENFTVPRREGLSCFAANHIRALLDLIEEGDFSAAQGMRDNFIDNSCYDDEIFEKVYNMKTLPNWIEIKAFIGEEYMMKWVYFLRNKENQHDAI